MPHKFSPEEDSRRSLSTIMWKYQLVSLIVCCVLVWFLHPIFVSLFSLSLFVFLNYCLFLWALLFETNQVASITSSSAGMQRCFSLSLRQTLANPAAHRMARSQPVPLCWKEMEVGWPAQASIPGSGFELAISVLQQYFENQWFVTKHFLVEEVAQYLFLSFAFGPKFRQFRVEDFQKRCVLHVVHSFLVRVPVIRIKPESLRRVDRLGGLKQWKLQAALFIEAQCLRLWGYIALQISWGGRLCTLPAERQSWIFLQCPHLWIWNQERTKDAWFLAKGSSTGGTLLSCIITQDAIPRMSVLATLSKAFCFR